MKMENFDGKRIPMTVGHFAVSAVFATSLLFASGCKSTPAPETATQTPAATPAPTPQIGGEDVVVLKRAATANGAKPEFLSATILPGRGMNLFQVTANIPGKGETNLFFAPSLTDAAAKMNGDPTTDMNGNASTSAGGAFLVPYPNRILGTLSPDGTTIMTSWNGHTLILPANWSGKKPGAPKHAIHGLILAAKVQDVKTEDTPDGQTVTGVIHGGDFGGHWLSQTDLNFKIELHGDAVDVTITAKNVGDAPEPMAIGWHPYFAIPSGDRTQARLHIPGSMLAEVNNYDDVFPTGKLKPVKGTVYDYTSPDGVPLDDHFLDDNFSHLTRTDGKVEVKLTDPKSGYGVDIEGLSPEIKTVQVYAPPTKEFVAIEEQYNFGDPFGKEWKGMDTGMVTLKPGASTTWHVRLQLFMAAK
jgi:galactose mutarotase-like enzyme